MQEIAKSARERKAAQRARDKRALIEAIGCEADAELRTLVELLRTELVQSESNASGSRGAWRAWREIGQRMGWIDDKDRVVEPSGPTLDLDL